MAYGPSGRSFFLCAKLLRARPALAVERTGAHPLGVAWPRVRPCVPFTTMVVGRYVVFGAATWLYAEIRCSLRRSRSGCSRSRRSNRVIIAASDRHRSGCWRYHRSLPSPGAWSVRAMPYGHNLLNAPPPVIARWRHQ